MPPDVRIQVDAADFRKSCGLKSYAGKRRQRLSALKLGMRGKSVAPVLPQKDPAESAAGIQEWVKASRSTNAKERDLAGLTTRSWWTFDPVACGVEIDKKATKEPNPDTPRKAQARHLPSSFRSSPIAEGIAHDSAARLRPWHKPALSDSRTMNRKTARTNPIW